MININLFFSINLKNVWDMLIYRDNLSGMETNTQYKMDIQFLSYGRMCKEEANST